MIQDQCNNRNTHEVLGKHRGGALLRASTTGEELLAGIVLQLDAQGQRGIHEARRGPGCEVR